MKTILMYTTDEIYTGKRITGGMKRFKMLYEYLISQGYNVELYCGDNENELKLINYKAKSINIKNVNKKNKYPNFYIAFKNFKLLLSLKRKKYDKVIVFDIPTAITLCMLKFKKINLFLRQDLFEYRKIWIEREKKCLLYKFFYLQIMKICEYICCRNSEKIIVQCNYDLNSLINRHKLLKRKILKKNIVQINNVNASWIIENSKEKVTLKNSNKNSFKVGFVGDFINPRKGHNVLLLAMKELLDDNINIEVYIIGDGIEKEKCLKKYKEYKSIKFLGKLENPMCIIKNMDLMIVPSLADSCPNTILESIYNDILVIGSNRGGIPEIFNDKEFLFEPNSKSIKDKVLNIMENKDYRNKLYNKQLLRKKELTFDWGKRIIDIII